MDRNLAEKKTYNKGFSLFTVIVAIAFVGILGMLVIYIAIANFNMKVTDLKGKDSFYTAEQAIEEIRVGLQEEVGDAMSEAYIEVLENYDQSENTQDETQDETRQKLFRKIFYENLGKRVQKVLDDGDLKSKYVDLTVNDDETLEIVDPTLSKLNPDIDEIKKNSKITLKNLKSIYVDNKGRASIIKTDIQLGIPSVKFATPSTLPDIKQMVVVANGGIVCSEDEPTSDPSSAKSVTMKGTIYAGLLDNEREGLGSKEKVASVLVKPNATLSILPGGEFFVCGGEINLAQNSSFTSNSGVSLWASGLSLKDAAKTSLLGDTYFSDDLTVNGNGDEITIAGNYYGYGSVESAIGASDLTQQKNDKSTDLSSAIIVNGKATKLDLSGVQKLMLAGKSYISDPANIMTGESVTVKGTQLAYLAPAEILGDEFTDSSNFTNPMPYAEYEDKLGEDTIPVKWDVAVEAWNNKTLRDIGVDEKEPVKKVIYPDNASETVVYFYLNFTDETKAAKFMREYYQENPEIKKQMDKYLSFYFGEDSGISVKDSDAYLLYVTNGNILSYSGDEESGKLYNASNKELTQKYLQKQIEYQKEWFALNRKMTRNYKILQKHVADLDDSTLIHDETDPTSTVFSNWVNERKLKEFLKDKTGKIYKYPNQESASIILYDNETGQPFKITKQEAENARLIICTGDVEIEEGTQFHGIIMSKGKITLNPNVQLESAPIDAAKAFQEQINDAASGGESVKVKDFLWYGDQYEFGSSYDMSNIGQNTETELTVYDLADCVTYSNWKKE